MTITIGSILKSRREELNLTQKKVADGICAQSMLSALENDQYIPNAELLIALCQRLSIDLNQIKLSNNYIISDETKINEQLNALCNQHKYEQLLSFLETTHVTNHLFTHSQLQAYYYYLAIAYYHVVSDKTTSIKKLNLALADFNPSKSLSNLDRLCLSTLGFIKNQSISKSSDKLFNLSLHNLDPTYYHENLNILFYLPALDAFKHSDYSICFDYIQKGINFTTNHNSHYMLVNFYYLLSQVAHKTQNLLIESEAKNRVSIFKELFDEEIHTEI